MKSANVIPALLLGASAAPSTLSLFARQGEGDPDICPQLPPWEQPPKLFEPAELIRLTENSPIRFNATGNFTHKASLEPESKLEKALNYDQLVAINPNASALFSRTRLVNPTVYPWSTVGKLWVSWPTGRKECTATLIGARTIITASKCIPWDTRYLLRFVPAYDGTAASLNVQRPFGTTYSSYCVGYNHNTGTAVNGLDYAVCRLNSPIGNSAGYLGWNSFADDTIYLNGLWASVGWPLDFHGGKAPAVQYHIKIDDVDHDIIAGLHGVELEDYQVFDAPGWIGGPLFNAFMTDGRPDGAVIGVMSGNETEPVYPCYDWIFRRKATVFAGGQLLTSLSAWARNVWR